MTKKHVKKDSSLLVSNEMENKTIVRYNYIHIKIDKI